MANTGKLQFIAVLDLNRSRLQRSTPEPGIGCWVMDVGCWMFNPQPHLALDLSPALRLPVNVAGQTTREPPRLASIRESFGAVRALPDVSFDLQPGEVHALLGCLGPALTHLHVEAYWDKAIQGIVILLAVVAASRPRHNSHLKLFLSGANLS